MKRTGTLVHQQLVMVWLARVAVTVFLAVMVRGQRGDPASTGAKS
jgi:hypothetical protein